MNITDELREYVQSWRENPNLMDDLDAGDVDGILADFERIADRIDERVTELLRKQDADLRAEFDLMNDGWVRLPKDADNVLWNVGDRDEDGNVVIALKLASDGWYVITDSEWPYRRPNRHRHYHAPTVEDVLAEFAAKLIERGELTNGGAQTIAEYAKRFRLAEEDA